MEYFPNGNLREFLRSSRNIYDVDADSLIPDPGQAIGPKTLVYFAWQVTKGMTFLISRKVSFNQAWWGEGGSSTHGDASVSSLQVV
jgi:hypothetical protein